MTIRTKIFCLFVCLFALFPTAVSYAYLLDASDILGQIDDSGDPIFTTDYFNNIPAINDAEPPVNPRGFFGPSDVLLDTEDHRLFVVDTSNSRVLVFELDSSDNLVNWGATHVLGQPDVTTGSSGLSSDTFNQPLGLALDSAGQRLFVADSNNNRVLVFDISSITDGEDAVNVLGQETFSTNATAATASGMEYPAYLAYDSVGERLIVSDKDNNRVLVYDVESITDGEDAVNVLGQEDFSSNVPAVSISGMNGPAGIVLDSSRLFVADSNNNRVTVFDISSITDGEDAVNVLGQPDFDSDDSAVTASGMTTPFDIALDAGNSALFVADSNSHRVVVFDVDSITDGEDAVHVLGQPDFVTDNSATTASGMTLPSGLDFDSSHNRLFVADKNNNRVLFFDVASISDGEDATIALGQGYLDVSTFDTNNVQNYVPNPVGFITPHHVAIDEVHHHLFTSDGRLNRVLVFNLDSDNNLIDHIADHVLGQADFSSLSTEVNASTTSDTRGIAVDTSGQRLFVADSGNNRVLIFDIASITNGEDAVNVLGQGDFLGNLSDTSASSFDTPDGLLYDAEHQRLFVAERSNSRVTVFDVTSITDGEDAVNVLGQPDFTSNTATTTQNGFWGSRDLAFDASGQRLFVGDYNNHRVTVFDVTSITDGEDATHVLGQPDFTTLDETPSQSVLGAIYGLAYDPITDQLLAVDVSRSAVAFFDVSTIVDGEPAINIIGQSNFSDTDTSTTRSGLFWSYGAYFDTTTRKLYLGDEENARVMIFSLPKITTTSIPDVVSGEEYFATISGTGGEAPYSCSVFSGSLPDGVDVTSDCEISGTPQGDGVYEFVVELEDSAATAPATSGLTHRKSFSLTVESGQTVEETPNRGGTNRKPKQPISSGREGNANVPTNNSGGSDDHGPVLSSIPTDLYGGSVGEWVVRLQEFLIGQNTGPAAQALARVGATGYFGPLTRAALAEYQLSVGITPTMGYFGPKTRAYLMSLGW